MATLFLPAFFGCRTTGQRLTIVLGILSLFITAYVLVLIPTKGKAGGPIILTPLQQYAPWMNTALSAYVAWSGTTVGRGFGMQQIFPIICCIPLLMYSVVMAARSFIIEADPAELEQLKYEFKGA